MIIKFKLFEQAEDITDWKLKLDISKIWNESIYNDPKKLENFNTQYINFLNENKELIIQKTSEDSWVTLEKLILNLNNKKVILEDCISIWEDIYDWADGNMVNIVTINSEQKKDF